MSRALLVAGALLLLVAAQSALAARVTHSHSLVRRNRAAFEMTDRDESEFPLCPSPDGDDQMECPKRNGICCSFEGRPTGRCCAAGETCTSDDPPQCVAYAGMRHLDRLVEKIDTGLNHVNSLDEGDAPGVFASGKRSTKRVVEESESSSSSSSSSDREDSKRRRSVRDDKLELLRDDALALEGIADGKYLNETEYEQLEKDLRLLDPRGDNFAPPNNDTESSEQREQDREAALQREASEEAERKEKEIEYLKQQENEKDKLEDKMEAQVEKDNSKLVDNLIAHDKLYSGYAQHKKVIRVIHTPSATHSSSSSSSLSSSSAPKIVVDHVNIVEQERRVAELKAKIAELEEPLKLQVEPDEAAVHALNYLKARLREIEEEGIHPTDSHKNNALEFLRAISNKAPSSSSSSSSVSSADDVPVAIATKITSFLPAGSLPTPCPVGIRC